MLVEWAFVYPSLSLYDERVERGRAELAWLTGSAQLSSAQLSSAQLSSARLSSAGLGWLAGWA
ncbi:hypothetical protein [Micromonospora rubida]|uniref:hypothetical protein n=1 Tax=Micromonospora rubida TaxID=2697657 RepID=UPI001377DC36|nr:hypothetical protein [Micromonospora rubida]NBE81512.1 hypothetical protein [Micromonospora rubida]